MFLYDTTENKRQIMTTSVEFDDFFFVFLLLVINCKNAT